MRSWIACFLIVGAMGSALCQALLVDQAGVDLLYLQTSGADFSFCPDSSFDSEDALDIRATDNLAARARIRLSLPCTPFAASASVLFFQTRGDADLLLLPSDAEPLSAFRDAHRSGLRGSSKLDHLFADASLGLQLSVLRCLSIGGGLGGGYLSLTRAVHLQGEGEFREQRQHWKSRLRGGGPLVKAFASARPWKRLEIRASAKAAALIGRTLQNVHTAPIQVQEGLFDDFSFSRGKGCLTLALALDGSLAYCLCLGPLQAALRAGYQWLSYQAQGYRLNYNSFFTENLRLAGPYIGLELAF